MKLIVILAIVALTKAAKLDRNYLPPSYAQTSGGSDFLQTPVSNSGLGFTRNNGVALNSNDYTQNGNIGRNYAQIGNNDFAQNRNNYAQNGFGQNGEYNANGFELEGRPERAQAAFERNAAILRQDTQNDGETYSYAYETENGIYGEESGVATNGVEAQGGYSYTGDDGQVYSVRYTADQNGFVPLGDHLPTPPPVPEEIQRALEQNARDEASGIYDDGSYNENKYGDNLYNGNRNYGNENYGFNKENNYSNNRNNYFNNRNNAYDDTNAFTDSDAVVVNSAESERPEFRSQAFGNRNGVNLATKVYLPPLNQSGNGRNSFGSRSRPSFNARTGYRY